MVVLTILEMGHFMFKSQLLEYPIPAPAAPRHKNRHMAISREPRAVS